MSKFSKEPENLLTFAFTYANVYFYQQNVPSPSLPPSSLSPQITLVKQRERRRQPESVANWPESVEKRPWSVAKRSDSIVKRPDSLVKRPESAVKRPKSAAERLGSAVKRLGSVVNWPAAEAPTHQRRPVIDMMGIENRRSERHPSWQAAIPSSHNGYTVICSMSFFLFSLHFLQQRGKSPFIPSVQNMKRKISLYSLCSKQKRKIFLYSLSPKKEEKIFPLFPRVQSSFQH